MFDYFYLLSEEKKHFEQNDFEVILPCELEQGKMLEMDYEPINVVLDLKKDASSFYNNDSMNSVVFDELEGFAA